MFENDLAELDAAGTLAAAEDNEHALITAETRRLHIAAHSADLHPGDAVPQSRMPGTEHPIRLGGDGTPTIADFAPAELGCALRISDGAAAKLIGDALDLRHRPPMIWTAALAGQTPAYRTSHIATATPPKIKPGSSMPTSHPRWLRCRGTGCLPCSRPPSMKPTRSAPSNGPP